MTSNILLSLKSWTRSMNAYVTKYSQIHGIEGIARPIAECRELTLQVVLSCSTFLPSSFA